MPHQDGLVQRVLKPTNPRDPQSRTNFQEIKMPNAPKLKASLFVIALAITLALAALACSADPTPDRSNFIIAPPPTTIPDSSAAADQPHPTQDTASEVYTPAAVATAAPVPPGPPARNPLNSDDLGHLPDNPTELMFAFFDHPLVDVGRKMAYSHNEAFIPVLMELLRLPLDEETSLTLTSFLVRIRDKIPENEFAIVPYGQSNWDYWVEWLAQNHQVAAPSGYDGWKGQLFGIVFDPRMGEFMYADVPTTIRLEEIVWGGVRRDGIPDLQFPSSISPEEAIYLDPGDRVFGVSINGEHRAYPLRVLNPHEMANDIVGGVQFALAY